MIDPRCPGMRCGRTGPLIIALGKRQDGWEVGGTSTTSARLVESARVNLITGEAGGVPSGVRLLSHT